MPQAPVLVNVVIVAVIFGLVMVPSISLWVYLGSKLARFLGDARKLRAFNITAAILLMLSLYPVLFH
jgi:threonine/homoserine/homoserine lactone efflux protein